ncbi:MAG TPA: hypothetical protein VFI45_11250 [Candidatus Acidoferrum sp.]|nr:hypothetical protein [Candidatus Acidoferrum sp.]
MQASIRTEQRGSKAQPFRGSEEGDEFPGMTGKLDLRFLSVAAETSGSNSSSAFV